MLTQRESWKSRIGFISAALGSAVGLGSIWRFPYVVGQNGGGAFILLYLIFLALIGFPVLITEILIGRTAKSSPYGSFKKIGNSKYWGFIGKITIFTGFIIASFYSVIAGWMLGYLTEAIKGSFMSIDTNNALNYFNNLSSSFIWSVGYHFLFIAICTSILFFGVRKGIEAKSKIMMPLLMIVLLILVIKGLMLPSASKGLKFMLSLNFKDVTKTGVLIALGQAFFTLSLGQGTMVTYGSYLSKNEDIPKSCFPVVLLNTLISILVGIAVFTIVFSANLNASSGPALIFESLPIVFSKMAFGRILSILFFILVVIAAITSEISALEPIIAYFIDEKKYSRHKATIISSLGAFLIGIPSALSFGVLKNFTISNLNFFDIISFLSVNILVPIGALFACILVAYRWKISKAFENLKVKDIAFIHSKPLFSVYFKLSVKYISPILILFILLNILKIF
jgi:NSS family neurotransmitter:Na+ symporter